MDEDRAKLEERVRTNKLISFHHMIAAPEGEGTAAGSGKDGGQFEEASSEGRSGGCREELQEDS